VLSRTRSPLVILFSTVAPFLSVIAQQTDSAAERIIITATEASPENTTIINPSDLSLTGDIRKIDSVASNASINDAGADSFTDVYAVRGLTNTPNFSKQALTLYVDDVPSASTFTNFTELGHFMSRKSRGTSCLPSPPREKVLDIVYFTRTGTYKRPCTIIDKASVSKNPKLYSTSQLGLSAPSKTSNCLPSGPSATVIGPLTR
jgi:hypothetical protein